MSKVSRKGVKRGNSGQSKKACRGMAKKDPIQKPESYMPQHEEGMPRHAKVGLIADFKGMPQHDQFMPRHDYVYETYFWQLGFNAV